MEGVDPSWPKPPVSETGASPSFRHIRMESRAAARLFVFLSCGRPPRWQPEIACDVEPRLAAHLELHDLRRADRARTRRVHTVIEMAMHLFSSPRGRSPAAPCSQ